MKSIPILSLSWRFFFVAVLLPLWAAAEPQPVTVTVAGGVSGSVLPPRFLGLSYESSMLLPRGGRYYFDAHNQALINTFRTLGIKSLRVGANAVDNPKVPVPQEKDIDQLFDFARAAGVKVIYSFRLKNGDPATSARLAAYLSAHDADWLDSFAIGNEPSFYLNVFDSYFALWKKHYDAILKMVPNAKFDGPCTGEKKSYSVAFAKALRSHEHLAMASDHFYFLGNGRTAESNQPLARASFLSNHVHAEYQAIYTQIVAKLASMGVAYRIDEMNSCSHGGALNVSDSYAATLWSLDCSHWWATHGILGLNFHTGESVSHGTTFGAVNYAAFMQNQAGPGFVMRPQAFGLLAFTQGAHGRSLPVQSQANPAFDFNAYAYRDADGSVYLTLINKSYGDHSHLAEVTLHLPSDVSVQHGQRMDLIQENQNVGAKTGVNLGGAAISLDGDWQGQWSDCGGGVVKVAPASAAIFHFPAATATTPRS